MFSDNDDIMYTVTVFGAFLISFFLSFIIFSAVVCYLCIKMEIIEMRLIVSKPKRKLSSVCMNSRSNIYEVVEVSEWVVCCLWFSGGFIFQDKKGSRHLYDKLVARNWCWSFWLIVCDLVFRCFCLLFVIALHKIESDDEGWLWFYLAGNATSLLERLYCW